MPKTPTIKSSTILRDKQITIHTTSSGFTPAATKTAMSHQLRQGSSLAGKAMAGLARK